ncbi:MAG: right-handed parallel beta-helix repeat-containing protein [Planctomycetia bacterium]|nr:right-handed parallel beta-helix repeat-containing protein [Planctomycetia bacterium]
MKKPYYMLFFGLIFLLGGSLKAAEFYVSPQGKDSNPGTKEAPFSTLCRARDALRDLKKSGKDTSGSTVFLAEGEYSIADPILFGPEDSGSENAPVLYKGIPGKSILSGGISLDGWREENGIWVANLPKKNGQPIYFEQLFVNDHRAIRARYPNKGFLSPEGIKEEFPMNPKTRKAPKPSTRQDIIAKKGDLDLLNSVPKEELKFGQLIVHHNWDTTRRIILGYDSNTRTVQMKGTPMKTWNPWRKTSLYCIENVRSAFDQPGEWFYDGCAGKVYYHPLKGEKIGNSRLIVPRSNLIELVRFEGTKDNPVQSIRFEGLTFAYTDSPRRLAMMKPAALDPSITGPLDQPGPSQFEPNQAAAFALAVISMDFANNVVLKNCRIEHIGEYGIWFKAARGCKILDSIIQDIGAGGVRIGSSRVDKYSLSHFNVVDNCIIREGGRVHASATGVWIGNNTEDNRLTHNDIGDFFYTGVSAGWNWGYAGIAFRNIIEYNRIHDIGQGALADMGGVYTLGTSTGTRVCNNVICNIKSFGYGGWGLYTDEGSEGILMENNLVYNTTDGSFHQHYGRNNIIRNNILVDSGPNPQTGVSRQVAATRIENHLSFTFENNIIYWTGGDAINANVNKAKINIRSNLWWNTEGKAEFGKKSHEDWIKTGKDEGGLVADPLFINPEHQDYRLKKNSPAFKIGFVPFDFTKAGVYGSMKTIAP